MNEIKQAIILCGGRGTRLSSVTNNLIPKSIIQIGSHPFIYYIFYQLEILGIKRVVLCTGFLSEKIEELIFTFNRNNKSSLEIIISRENKILGTAGALKNSLHLLQDKYSIVINGDTYVNSNLNIFLNNHFIKKKTISILGTFKYATKDFGVIYLNKDQTLNRFKEKKISFFKYVYAGILIIDNNNIDKIPKNDFLNLEDFLFIKNKFTINVFKSNYKFIDIGTKKNFHKYSNFFSSLKLPYL